jgi:flagellar motor switch protein FliN/FliY
MPDGPVRAQRADFEPFDRAGQVAGGAGNIELLLDVSLPVAIELGRTHMSIRDILELGSGSIVELDKLAGEPVDILVNNKPLAKGEVVVIDENFGVRITSLVPPRERLERLNA